MSSFLLFVSAILVLGFLGVGFLYVVWLILWHIGTTPVDKPLSKVGNKDAM